MSVYIPMCTWMQVPVEARGFGVIGSCGPPTTGTGNQTQVPFKNGLCSCPWAISPAHNDSFLVGCNV